jgi:hypothetical protein
VKFIDQGVPPAEVDSALSAFKELKARQKLRGEQADIDRYPNFQALQQAVDAASATQSKSDVQQAAKSSRILVDEGPDFVVIMPDTEEASKLYGSGTKWCTAAQSGNKFGTYHGGLKFLVYAVNKTTRKKYAMNGVVASGHVLGAQFYDDADHRISRGEFSKLSGWEPDDEKIREASAQSISVTPEVSFKNHFAAKDQYYTKGVGDLPHTIGGRYLPDLVVDRLKEQGIWKDDYARPKIKGI